MSGIEFLRFIILLSNDAFTYEIKQTMKHKIIAKPAIGDVKITEAKIPKSIIKKISVEVIEDESDLIFLSFKINTKLSIKLLMDLLR